MANSSFPNTSGTRLLIFIDKTNFTFDIPLLTTNKVIHGIEYKMSMDLSRMKLIYIKG